MEEHILFSKIQQGDAGAFEWLYKKYHPRMYVFCYGLLHDSDKAKDIAQECFVAFWEYRTRIDAPKAISTYLFCIMKNLCMKQIRRDAILDNFSKIETMHLRELELASYADEHNILNDLYFDELNNKYLDALE